MRLGRAVRFNLSVFALVRLRLKHYRSTRSTSASPTPCPRSTSSPSLILLLVSGAQLRTAASGTVESNSCLPTRCHGELGPCYIQVSLVAETGRSRFPCVDDVICLQSRLSFKLTLCPQRDSAPHRPKELLLLLQAVGGAGGGTRTRPPVVWKLSNHGNVPIIPLSFEHQFDNSFIICTFILFNLI